jgi:hypothetical protein
MPRVAIVGTGFVGSTTAYALLMSGIAAEIVLIDRDRRWAEGHLHDLRDAEVFSRNTRVSVGDIQRLLLRRCNDHYDRSQSGRAEIPTGRPSGNRRHRPRTGSRCGRAQSAWHLTDRLEPSGRPDVRRMEVVRTSGNPSHGFRNRTGHGAFPTQARGEIQDLVGQRTRLHHRRTW